MENARKRTSMSVPEMGRLLGLCKTESYWLIKKNYFKTITVGGNMRVMIDSFESWYANQFKYQKVDGTPPGEELKKTTYSVEELGQRLGLKEATAYELIAKGHFEIVEVLGKRRITKDSFERWYASQSDYRTIEDQEKDAEIVAVTYGLPEIARMLGVHRQNVYGIYELILETVLCSSEKILIASNWYPAELVRSKFLKLNYSHIEYVLDCFKRNTSKVKNIKKYMLAALFNAPTTIDGYYQAEVNHDMPQFAV